METKLRGFLTAALLCLTATGPAFSQEPSTDEPLFPAVQASMRNKILGYYNDPRVIAVVRQAQTEGRSISVDLSPRPPTGDAPLVAAADPATQPAAPAKPAKDPHPYNYFGAIVDAGVPDLFGLSGAYRPWRWLRTEAGVTTDTLTSGDFGVRAGVTFTVPSNFFLLPSATVEAGHVFRADISRFTGMFASDNSFAQAFLSNITYDYINGQLGLEIGVQNRCVLLIHGGVTYMAGTVRDFQQGAQTYFNNTKITADNPSFSYIGPSGKVGLLVYFW